jgi:hypothetical protein
MYTCSNSASEAQESLVKLHVAVEKMLDTMHATSVQNLQLQQGQQALSDQLQKVQQTLSLQMADSDQALFIQLRDLIARRCSTVDAGFNIDLHKEGGANVPDLEAGSLEHISTSPTTAASSAGSWMTSTPNSRCDRSDAASIKTTATTSSLRSIRSLVSSQDALQSSRAYKRLRRRGVDSDSIFSVESSDKGCA